MAELILEQHRSAVLQAAGEIYRANIEGSVPSPDLGTVHVSLELGDATTKELEAARDFESELNVAARAIARVADVRDAAEGGDVLAKLELLLTGVADRRYLGGRKGDVLKPGGLVDNVRGKASAQH